MCTIVEGEYVLVDYKDPNNPEDVRTYPAEVLRVNGNTFDCRWHASDHQISCGLPISDIHRGGVVHGEAFVGFGSGTPGKESVACRDNTPIPDVSRGFQPKLHPLPPPVSPLASPPPTLHLLRSHRMTHQ